MLDQDLSAVIGHGAAARGQLDTMAYLTPSWGRVGADILALRRTPATNGKIVGWAARGATPRLVGYVWGWSVRNPRTGVTDNHWYALRDPTAGTRPTAGPQYVYAPLALVAASSTP